MNKPFTLFWWLVAILSLSGCERPPVHTKVEGVIENASLARLGNLVGAERNNLGNCCSYIGVDPKKRKTFSPAQGYWVRVNLHNKKLARASLLNSCGSSLKPQNCQEAELANKIAMAFESNHYQALYGKGLTRFILYDETGEAIHRTAKHGGHIVGSLRRDGDTDYFTIGPVSVRPHAVSIFMSTSLQEFRFDLGK